MKPFLPYNILLVLALAVAGLAVYYNLALRETFAVTVSYALPVPSRAETSVQEGPVRLYSDEPASSRAEEFYDESPATVILVSFPLDINRASMDELMYIPQVGGVMAQRIVQYRDVLGGYTDLLQLRDIKGVGDKTYETISAYLYIADEALAESAAETPGPPGDGE